MAKGHAARAKRLCARPWPMVTEGRGEAVAGRWRLCTWLGRVTAMMSAPEGARGKGGGRARSTVRVERWICADGGPWMGAWDTRRCAGAAFDSCAVSCAPG